MRYLIVIIILFSLPAYAENGTSQILEGITPNSITVIGETHKRPESIKFFQSLITGYTQQNKCLTIALEIASSQQLLLDEIMQGSATVTDLEIPSVIDHPPLRTLIDELAEMRNHNDCIKLIAIDAGLELKTNRDEWMARKLNEQAADAPVLALLGSLHTLKKVDWNTNVTKKKPYIAEILASQGHNIRSYPQVWAERECNAQFRLIPADKPEATKLLNSKLIASLNAFESKTALDVIDGIILWECN